MIIYKKYKQPPEPPKHLWLIIDLKKLKFNTNQDLDYIKNCVIRYNPELYTEINKIYKIYEKNRKSYLSVINKYDLMTPKLMRKKRK